MKYNEYVEKTYETLQEYMEVNREHFNKVESEHAESKKFLNGVLELTPENNFRKIFNLGITEHQFKTEFPITYDIIKDIVKEDKVANGNPFSIIKNLVDLGKGQSLKLSKLISKRFRSSMSDEYHNRCKDGMNEVEMQYHSLDNYVSVILDITKPKNICISTNIYDMFTSSTNAAYHSCYNMDKGEFFNGNIAYARDAFTCIAFIYTDDIHRKIGRTWLYVFPDDYKILMPMKPYGSIYNPQRKLIRKYIEHQICKFHGTKNYWKFNPKNKYNSGSYNNGRPGYDSAVYFDTSKVGMAWHKRITNSTLPCLEFEDARCLQCGNITSHAQGGACEDCYSEYKCNECGDSIHSDDIYSDDNGNTICRSCYDSNYIECVDCGTISYVDDSYNVEVHGNICQCCRENDYSYCTDCDELYDNNNIHSVEDGNRYVCEHCLSDYTECKECGEYHNNDDITEIGTTDKYVCRNCQEDYYICDDCDELHHCNNINSNDDGTYCNECYQEHLEETAVAV